MFALVNKTVLNSFVQITCSQLMYLTRTFSSPIEILDQVGKKAPKSLFSVLIG